MKVTVERMPESAVALDIVAEEDEFSQAMDRAFRKISRQVRIPGFRPGRAPRALIEQRIGREAIVEEAQREIMDTLYRRALEQEELVPVSDPAVDIYQDEPVGFRIEVQVYPTVSLGDYTSIRIEPREVNLDDADVQRVLDDLQKNNTVWKEPETPRLPGDSDQVLVDLQAFEGDEPFQDPVNDATFVLGEGNMFPEIEAAIRNLHPGETAEFDINFEDDDEKATPDLRGKTLHYTVTLKELKEAELPEIDDELAKTAGAYETVDDLTAAVRKDLLRSQAVQARTELVNEAIETLAAAASMEIPAAMVNRQVEDDLQRLQQELTRENMAIDEFLRFGNKTKEEYKEEIRPDAERRLRNSVVLDAFAKAENVEVSEEDILAEIDRLTAPSENPEQLRQIYTTPYFQRMIMDELANRKLTDHLIELVTEGQGAVTGEGADALRDENILTATTTDVSGDVAESVNNVLFEDAEAAEANDTDALADVSAENEAAHGAAAEPNTPTPDAEIEREGK